MSTVLVLQKLFRVCLSVCLSFYHAKGTAQIELKYSTYIGNISRSNIGHSTIILEASALTALPIQTLFIYCIKHKNKVSIPIIKTDLVVGFYITLLQLPCQL